MSEDIYVMRLQCVICGTLNRMQEIHSGCKNPDCANKLRFEVIYAKKDEL